MHESAADNQVAFSWVAHPVRERPVSALLAASVILAIGVATSLWADTYSERLLYGGVAVAVLVMSLQRFFFRSRYCITPQHVDCRSLLGRQRLLWSDVGHVCHDRRGVSLYARKLVSRSDDSQRRSCNAMHLMFGRSREEVIQLVGRYGQSCASSPPKEISSWTNLRSRAREWGKDVFAVDPNGPAEPTPRQQPVVDWICLQIAKRHLTTPGLLLLEMGRPLNFIFAQTMYASQPAMWAVASRQSYQDYLQLSSFLEHRGSFEYVAQRIEHFEQEMQRIQKAGQPVGQYIEEHLASLRRAEHSGCCASPTGTGQSDAS